MRKLCIPAIVISSLFIFPTFQAQANPPAGKGMGKGVGVGQGVGVGKGVGVGQGVGVGKGVGVGNPHGQVPVTAGTAVPPGLAGKAVPPGLAKQGKVPYGWSKGNAWWKNDAVTVPQVKVLTVPQRQDAINQLRGLKTLTPSQAESLKILQDNL